MTNPYDPTQPSQEPDPTQQNSSQFGAPQSNPQFEQPYGGYPQPGMQQPMPAGYGIPAVKPDNNLVFAILSTVFCFWPLGGFAIYYATQVDKFWAMGNIDEATAMAEKAKKFSIYAAITAVVLWILFIILYVVVIVAALNSA